MQNLLSNPQLFQEKCYLNGNWVDSEAQPPIRVINPATQETIGTVPNMGADQTRETIIDAEKAQEIWRKKTAKERAKILMRFHDLMIEHQEDLAIIMTTEQGKPLTESRGEIIYGASFLEWFAEEGKRIYGDIIPTFAADKRILVYKQPIGVVGAITPWNFPSAMITRKCAPALAAGCSIIIKPAESTPFSALALAVLAEQAGIPPGVFNVITGGAHEIGEELTQNKTVKKISFTGSTEVGKHLMRECADTVKKISLELGGHAPFIVFPDADIDEAVQGAIMSKYRNSGQTCVCTNRFYIHDDVYDEFARKFADAASKLKVNNGMSEDSQQGPLINEEAIKKVEEHIQDAKNAGARILTGGQRHELGGTFFEPTVLAQVTPLMKICHEETFGPVAPLIRFKSEKEVIELANSTPYGLAAYFYAKDMSQIIRVSEKLEFGMVGVNTGILSTEVAPFGGIKESGFGREGSKYGIEEYVQTKYTLLSL